MSNGLCDAGRWTKNLFSLAFIKLEIDLLIRTKR